MAELPTYTFDRLNPKKIKPGSLILLVGPRNTGKSVCLRDLAFHMRHNFDVGMAMCGTESSAEMMTEFLPPQLVHSEKGYDDAVMTQFISVARRLRKVKKTRKVLVIEDDLFSDKGYIKAKNQVALFVNGRHWSISKITCCQHCMLIPNYGRTNIDYVFASRETIVENRVALFKHYFGCFPNIKEFNRVFDALTKNYGWMVIDKTVSTGRLQDLIKTYRAEPNLPPFRFGKPIYWRFARFVEEYVKHQQKIKRLKGIRTTTI